MRAPIVVSLLLASLAGCSAQPEAMAVRTPQAQRELDRFLTGKVAGAPVSCINDSTGKDMTVVDEETLIFRDGANRLYRNDPPGGCPGAGRPGYALVFKLYGGTGLCRGQIVQVTDLQSGTFGGSCSLGDFVPYEKPRVRG
jgi:hypothetical protein